MLKLGFCILLMCRVEAFVPSQKSYVANFVTWNTTCLSAWDFHIRLLGRERRMNGSVDIWEDITDDHFTIEIQTYIDSAGSGNYKPYPFSMPEQSACKFIKTYWPYCADSAKFGVNTDIPFGKCPLPKGHYYVKDILINTSKWPLIFPRGFLKSVVTVKKDGEVVATQILVVEIKDRLI